LVAAFETNGTNFATITVNAPTGGSDLYHYDFKVQKCAKEQTAYLYQIQFILGGSYTIKVL
jgi:hypothetical protein